MQNQNEIFKNMVEQSGGKIDRQTLENAAKNHSAAELVKNLSDTDKQKLESILYDKEKLEQVLKSPQAKMLFKMFGGGKNG